MHPCSTGNIERRANVSPLCTLRTQISFTLYNVARIAYIAHAKYANTCGYFQFYNKQDRKWTYDVTLRCVHVTTVGVETQ